MSSKYIGNYTDVTYRHKMFIRAALDFWNPNFNFSKPNMATFDFPTI